MSLKKIKKICGSPRFTHIEPPVLRLEGGKEDPDQQKVTKLRVAVCCSLKDLTNSPVV
jgi:hypothetical protein